MEGGTGGPCSSRALLRLGLVPVSMRAFPPFNYLCREKNHPNKQKPPKSQF